MPGQLLSAKLLGGMDLPKLSKAMDKKEQKVLFKTSAYARTTMRRGMRRKKKPGAAGGYPAAHAGGIKETIAFAVDTRSGTSVVGPTPYSKQPSWLPAGISNVPQLLNEGGTVRRRIRKKQIVQVYEPRPFVDLANEKAAKKFAENMETIPLGV